MFLGCCSVLFDRTGHLLNIRTQEHGLTVGHHGRLAPTTAAIFYFSIYIRHFEDIRISFGVTKVYHLEKFGIFK